MRTPLPQKAIVLLLVMCMVFGLAACGSNTAPADSSTAPTVSEPIETPDLSNSADIPIEIIPQETNNILIAYFSL